MSEHENILEMSEKSRLARCDTHVLLDKPASQYETFIHEGSYDEWMDEGQTKLNFVHKQNRF